MDSEESLKCLKEQNLTLDNICDYQLVANNALNDLKFQIEENGRELVKLNATLNKLLTFIAVAVTFYITTFIIASIK